MLNRNLILSLAMMIGLVSQVTAQGGWTRELLGPEAFVENQGQYDAVASLTGAPVRFAADYGFGWQAYFTSNGVGIQIRKVDYTVEEMETFHCEPEKGTVSQTFILAEWIGRSSTVALTTRDVTPDYYTFCYESAGQWIDLSHVSAYRKLVYEGIYPNTDIEYTSPKEGGIKYSIRLHPGADPSNLRLRYTGSPVTKDGQGNLRMNTVLGDLVDHAPSAWYADNPNEKIPVQFILSGNEVTFSLGAYDNSREVVIDPWTVNPALPAPFNRAFEVDVDNAGNVYVFGGGMGYNLKKYNSAGTLQWTHVSPWDTSNAWFGELLTLPGGDCFITSGSAAKIRRLTTAGATTFTNNGPFFNVDEYWNLSLNCDRTKLIAGGSKIIGLTSPQGHVFDLNMATGNVIASYNISPTGMVEIRGLQIGSDGYLYAMSNSNVIKLDPFTLATYYSTGMGYSYPYYSPTYMAQSVQGVNNIEASQNYLYTAHGNQIEYRSLATGATIGSAPLGGGWTTGLFGSGNTIGGVVTDQTGSNIFAAGAGPNRIIRFNSTLGVITTYAMPAAIYDLVMSPISAVIAGGDAFVSSTDLGGGIGPKTSICPVLPITLSFLNTTCTPAGVQINWETGSEVNMDYFLVERSENGSEWTGIGNIPGKGGDGIRATYRFTDLHLPVSAQNQPIFYRLKAVDKSGAYQYSGISTIERCGEGVHRISVFPTVTDRFVAAEMYLETAAIFRLEVINGVGQTVRSITYNGSDGMNTVAVDLESLPAAMYNIRFVLPDGSLAGTPVKVVKE